MNMGKVATCQKCDRGRNYQLLIFVNLPRKDQLYDELEQHTILGAEVEKISIRLHRGSAPDAGGSWNPRLAQASYRITSLSTRRYNCIAWAAEQTANWWWPGPNLAVENMPFEHQARVIRAIDVDVLGFPEVVGEHRQVFYMVIMLVGDEHSINRILLFQRKRRCQAPGVYSKAIVYQDRHKANISAFALVRSQNPYLHTVSPYLPTLISLLIV